MLDLMDLFRGWSIQLGFDHAGLDELLQGPSVRFGHLLIAQPFIDQSGVPQLTVEAIERIETKLTEPLHRAVPKLTRSRWRVAFLLPEAVAIEDAYFRAYRKDISGWVNGQYAWSYVKPAFLLARISARHFDFVSRLAIAGQWLLATYRQSWLVDPCFFGIAWWAAATSVGPIKHWMEQVGNPEPALDFDWAHLPASSLVSPEWWRRGAKWARLVEAIVHTQDEEPEAMAWLRLRVRRGGQVEYDRPDAALLRSWRLYARTRL